MQELKEIQCSVGELFNAIQESQNLDMNYEQFYHVENTVQIQDENNAWIDVVNVIKKQRPTIKIQFADASIEGATTHLIANCGTCKKLEEFQIGDVVLDAFDMPHYIKSIESTSNKKDVYDFEVDSESHLYQTANNFIHHNTGKSEFVINLSRFLKQKVVRVNFSLGTTEGHLIGKFIVKDGSTKFVDGVVPMAMKNGWWLLLDEIDYASPEHLSVLQPVLEGDALILVQNENETIVPHENFRVFATANTKGRGDASQSYTGTNFMNMAFVDRWSIFEFEYTKHEKSIVTDILGKDSVLATQILKYFVNIRKSVEKNEIINAAFSTRRMIHFCEALAVGETLVQALDYEIFKRYDKVEADILKELAFDIWDKEHYMKSWKLGDAHSVDANQLEVTATAAE